MALQNVMRVDNGKVVGQDVMRVDNGHVVVLAPGGEIDLSKIKVGNFYDFSANFIDAECMESQFYRTGIFDTDYKSTLYTYTATNKCKVFFADWSRAYTNTGNGEGYISIDVNDVEMFKFYLIEGGARDVDFGTFTLEQGDVLKLNVGFDNEHTNCRFFIQTCPVILLQ